MFAVLAAVFAVGTCTPYGTYGGDVQHHEPIKNEIHSTGYGHQVHHEPIHHEPIHHEPIHHAPVHHEVVHHEVVHHREPSVY